MPFPPSARVEYQNNPLDQVICQFKFPVILRISTHDPADFQDAIRQEYPHYEDKKHISIIPPEMAEALPPSLASGLVQGTKRAYDFSSEDKAWVVSLTNNFLSLTAHNYKRWEEFIQHLEAPFEALKSHYTPPFFLRVGLRYVNVIRRSQLGLEDKDWRDLLETHILGELGASDVGETVIERQVISLIKLNNELGTVRFSHGIIEDKDTGEECYLIDSDFFVEDQMEVDNGLERLSKYNYRARTLFRWAITEELHKAMGPEELR